MQKNDFEVFDDNTFSPLLSTFSSEATAVQMAPRSGRSVVSSSNLYLGVLVVLIFINLNLFMVPTVSPPSAANAPPAIHVPALPPRKEKRGAVALRLASGASLEATSSNSGEYISLLQESILSEQEAIGQVEAQNKMISEVGLIYISSQATMAWRCLDQSSGVPYACRKTSFF